MRQIVDYSPSTDTYWCNKLCQPINICNIIQNQDLWKHTSRQSKNCSTSSLNAVHRISPLPSTKSTVKKLPSPFEFDHVRTVVLLVTLALMTHLLWNGLRLEIGLITLALDIWFERSFFLVFIGVTEISDDWEPAISKSVNGVGSPTVYPTRSPLAISFNSRINKIWLKIIISFLFSYNNAKPTSLSFL